MSTPVRKIHTRSGGRGQINFEKVNRAALAVMPVLLARWLPDGKRLGGEWVALNPHRTDRKPGSFKVNIRTGMWADFATGDHGGDPVSLVAFLSGMSQAAAARNLAQMLGWTMNEVDPMFVPLKLEESVALAPKVEEWTLIIPVPKDAPMTIPAHHLGQPSGVWEYRDTVGNLLGLVTRFDLADGKKEFAPSTFREGPNGQRGWRWKGIPEPRPLYGLDRLSQRPEAKVLVVEGEKTADAAAQLFPDLVVVTSSGGARAAGKSDWTPLKGRHVTVWPDADKPGHDYAAEVVGLVHAVGVADVRTVNVPSEFPGGWDLADEPPTGWASDQIRTLLDVARLAEKGAPSTLKLDDNVEASGVDRTEALPSVDCERGCADAGNRSAPRKMDIDKIEKGARRKIMSGSGQGNELELPTPEPWDEPVDGADLVMALVTAIRRHVVMEEGAAESMALWALHAHALDAFGISPRLAITSPEKGCGKTTALDVLGRLVPRPLSTANITTAAIFRTIEKVQPTLLMDEADTFIKGNDEMRGVLNSGHRRSAAYVVRTVGKEFEPRKFSTWAATAIAMIGRLPDTLEDRSISIRLRRRLPSEGIEGLRGDQVSELDVLARKAARWAADNLQTLRHADPVMPSGIINRLADNWRPLLAIADVVGGEWGELIRRVALSMVVPENSEQSARVLLLQDIREIFLDKDRAQLPSAELVAALIAMEDRPWSEWRHGKPITQTGLAKQLAPFNIKSGNTRQGEKVTKGYRREQFDDAFARYIPDITAETATPLQSAPLCGLPEESQPLHDGRRSGSKNAENPRGYAECSGVAAEGPWEIEL